MNRSKTWTSIFCAVAGLATGWLAGGRGISRSPSSSDPGKPAAVANAKRPERASEVGGPRRDFASYARRVGHPEEQQEADAAVERMSSAGLRDLLLKAPPIKWDTVQDAERYLLNLAVKAAAKELIRREGVAAFEWSDANGGKETRFAVLDALFAVDPASAYDRMRNFNFAYSGNLASAFPWTAMDGAAMRGADDVIAFEKLWNNGASLERITEFAPDFDFQRYLSGSDSIYGCGPALKKWTAEDPDAAGRAIVEGVAQNRKKWLTVLRDALEARAILDGEEKAAQWVGSLLAKMPPGSFRESVGEMTASMTEGRADALVRILPQPEDQLAVASVLAKAEYNAERIQVAALKALDSPERQAEALMDTVQTTERYPWTQSGFRERFSKRLDVLMDKVGMSEDQRTRVRAAFPGE